VLEDVASDGDGLGVVAEGEENLPGPHGVGLEEDASMFDVLEGGIHGSLRARRRGGVE
jgi:hypothetical protein